MVTRLDRDLGALRTASFLTIGTGFGGTAALLMAIMFGAAGRVLGSVLLVLFLTWLSLRCTRRLPGGRSKGLVLAGVVVAVLVAFLSWWSVREETLHSHDALELRLVGEAMVGTFLAILPISWLQNRTRA